MSWIIITAIIIILALWWLINSTNTPKSGIKSSAEKISVQGPLKHIRSQKKRERLEDIIKDLYHEIAAGHEETKPIIDSLSQKLGVKVQKLNKDIDILREAGFVSSSSLELTSQGKEYALGLIRKHRLYERYLAEHSVIALQNGTRSPIKWSTGQSERTESHIGEITQSANRPARRSYSVQ
ncbi:iron dependent repressor, metal binding and dimerization domain protein [Porphyromonas macacae]|uniref:iron dependent repressor, metal binding and dimerization domain protein n=1 Tax=Porphyromonas macacae TaxID=28115 RepID=UPI00138AAF49|nr:iron dependent repressor, metal binding and dimerization domain protein [Porphyromonas macacae]